MLDDHGDNATDVMLDRISDGQNVRGDARRTTT